METEVNKRGFGFVWLEIWTYVAVLLVSATLIFTISRLTYLLRGHHGTLIIIATVLLLYELYLIAEDRVYLLRLIRKRLLDLNDVPYKLSQIVLLLVVVLGVAYTDTITLEGAKLGLLPIWYSAIVQTATILLYLKDLMRIANPYLDKAFTNMHCNEYMVPISLFRMVHIVIITVCLVR